MIWGSFENTLSGNVETCKTDSVDIGMAESTNAVPTVARKVMNEGIRVDLLR